MATALYRPLTRPAYVRKRRPAKPEVPLNETQRQLLQANYRLAYMELKRLGPCRIDRDELESTALYAACKAARTYNTERPTSLSFGGWVRKVIRCDLWKLIKRSRFPLVQKVDGACSLNVPRGHTADGKEKNLLQLLTEDGILSPLDKVINQEQILYLRVLLSGIPLRRRQALEYHFVDELSLAETAKKLNMGNRQAVHTLIKRTLAKLRKQMDQEGFNDL